MTTQAVATPQVADAADSRWQRLLPLSDLAFVPLFLVGWFMSGGVTPHYGAADQLWVNWAQDNQWKGRIGSPFGYGFFPGAMALVTWTAATSVATYSSTA
jgi:hypothetical protein